MKKILFFVLAFACLGMIAACGDDGVNLNTTVVIVAVPNTETINQGESMKFLATALHNLLPYNGEVKWGVQPESVYDDGAKFEPEVTNTNEYTTFTAPVFAEGLSEPYKMYITATVKGTTKKYKLSVNP